MRTTVERPGMMIGRPMMPTGAVGDALVELSDLLAARPVPEDVDEILGLRCRSL